MTTRKSLVLLLMTVFLAGSAGLVAAQEKKMAAGKAMSANGTVKAISADSLTVLDTAKKERTFAMDPKTSIKKAGKAIGATDLKEGDTVHVRFTEADGKLHAGVITVKAGSIAKKEAK